MRREAREKEPDSIRANMKTLEPFRARLAAAHEALDRPLPPAGRQGTLPGSGRQAVSAPESLRALLDEGLERGFFAGASALVVSEKETLAERHAGDARVEPASERRAAGPDTLWDLASLTKPLAGAALVLSLVSEKTLSLDDCVSRFEDRWKKTFLEGIESASLLAHTAGLVDWFPLYSRGEGRAAYVRTLGELDAAAIPGTKVIYSCPGYLFLSEIVERVSGAPVDGLFEATSPPLFTFQRIFSSLPPLPTTSPAAQAANATTRPSER